MPLYIGIEAGGTKFVCAAGSDPVQIFSRSTFPTTTPEETVRRTINFIRECSSSYGEINALGIASFGPIDPNPFSPRFGYITETPKPGWSNFNLVGEIKRAFDLPVGFDTDVNGAGLGEWRWGAAQKLDTFIYMTIGTGIGGGGMINEKLLHGMIHPEMGHIRIPHNFDEDPFEGGCPFHGDCFEGLANGPAMEKRWGKPAEELSPEHPAWDLEAKYIALALTNYICTLSPQRIILGGGVMHQEQLFPMVRSYVQGLLNEYVQSKQIMEDIDHYIVPPALGDNAGVLGAIALAIQAEHEYSKTNEN